MFHVLIMKSKDVLKVIAQVVIAAVTALVTALNADAASTFLGL